MGDSAVLATLTKENSTVEFPIYEDNLETKQKLLNCSKLISKFLKTLDDNQVKSFFDIEISLSDYYASREELIIKNNSE